jgi:hypothetical protein
VEVTPLECRDALAAGKITIQGQKMDFKIGRSEYLTYYSEGGRTKEGACSITAFTRNGVTYQKSCEETTIQVQDEDPRSQLAQEERARRAKAPLLCCLVAQEQARIEADPRTKQLRQKMR